MSGDPGGRSIAYGRPREGSANGFAVARTSPPPPDFDDWPSTYYYPTVGYYPWGYGGYGFGGYYGSGFYFSVHAGFYNPWFGFGYSGYYPGYYPGYFPGYYSLGYADDGAVRLKVKPNNASVFVDGYFAGEVDEFDGNFQRLYLEPGPHRIEVRADGLEPLFFEVRTTPGRTVTYTGELKRP